jgi:hypothetical protein
VISPIVERVTDREPQTPPTNEQRWAAVSAIYRAERIAQYLRERGDQHISAGIALAYRSAA